MASELVCHLNRQSGRAGRRIEGLSHALARATTAVKEMRGISPRAFMARSPLIALVVAAGIGV